MLTTACKKEVSLVGTTWYGSFEMNVTEHGYGRMNLLGEYKLYFVNETEGYVLMKGTLSQGGAVVYSEQQRQLFTYTFDGCNGTMTNVGDPVPDKTSTFVYDDASQTITMTVYSQAVIDAGITEVVFTPQK